MRSEFHQEEDFRVVLWKDYNDITPQVRDLIMVLDGYENK